jgi:hypothetical protein
MLAGLGAIGLAIAGVGFLLDLKGFLGNVLAGLSSLILGAVLAVGLITHLLNRQRREQWCVVRREIVRAVCEGVVSMATAFALVLSDDAGFLDLTGSAADLVAQPQIAAALLGLIAVAEADAAELAAGFELDRASSRVLYDQVAVAVEPLRAATTTRVIVLGDEPRLVEVLLILERRERLWGELVTMVERAEALDEMAWQQATDTLRASVDVYRYFLSKHEVGCPLTSG